MVFSGAVGDLGGKESARVGGMLVTSKRPLPGAKISRHLREGLWVLSWITVGGLQGAGWVTEVSEQRGKGT